MLFRSFVLGLATSALSQTGMANAASGGEKPIDRLGHDYFGRRAQAYQAPGPFPTAAPGTAGPPTYSSAYNPAAVTSGAFPTGTKFSFTHDDREALRTAGESAGVQAAEELGKVLTNFSDDILAASKELGKQPADILKDILNQELPKLRESFRDVGSDAADTLSAALPSVGIESVQALTEALPGVGIDTVKAATELIREIKSTNVISGMYHAGAIGLVLILASGIKQILVHKATNRSFCGRSKQEEGHTSRPDKEIGRAHV